MTDLDGLKRINDEYGHTAGDTAIRIVAEALKKCCPEDTLCVRFGGDEMLAVIKSMYDKKRMCEKIGNYLKEYNNLSGMPYTVAASIGVIHARGKEILHFENLIKKVDEQMYIDKGMNKINRIE